MRLSRCEWPGCGARAIRCDQDHDLGWLDDLTPLQREDALLAEDPGSSYFDGSADSGRCDDTEPPDDHDRLRRRIRSGDTDWTLDLDDLQNWLPAEADRDPAARA